MDTMQECRITTRLNPEAFEKVEEIAKKHGLTLSSMVRIIIMDWMTAPQRKEDLLDIL